MLFPIAFKDYHTGISYPTDDVNLAKKFAERLKYELGDFLKCCVIFGSTVRASATERSDIDVLVVVDDVDVNMTNEMVEAYKLIIEHLIQEISLKLHVTSMTYTSFWEYVKAGDPIAINILRDGYALHDVGFFRPLQVLLKQGRIRPSPEAIWNYYGRAPRTILNARWHLLQATVDLYWACIDSAHAALMKIGEIPPSPEHVAEMMEEKLVRAGHVEKRYVNTMRMFYKVSKQIIHRETRHISGPEFERYFKEAKEFVDKMRIFIEKRT